MGNILSDLENYNNKQSEIFTIVSKLRKKATFYNGRNEKADRICAAMLQIDVKDRGGQYILTDKSADALLVRQALASNRIASTNYEGDPLDAQDDEKKVATTFKTFRRSISISEPEAAEDVRRVTVKMPHQPNNNTIHRVSAEVDALNKIDELFDGEPNDCSANLRNNMRINISNLTDDELNTFNTLTKTKAYRASINQCGFLLKQIQDKSYSDKSYSTGEFTDKNMELFIEKKIKEIVAAPNIIMLNQLIKGLKEINESQELIHKMVEKLKSEANPVNGKAAKAERICKAIAAIKVEDRGTK